MNFKNYFSNLSFFQKVELYLLVPIFAWFLIYSIDKTTVKSSSTISKPSIYKKAIDNIKDKVIKKEDIFFVSYIQNGLDNYNLVLNNIDIKKDTILLNSIGSFDSGINFLKTIEDNIFIKQITIKPLDKNISLDVVIKLPYYYDTQIVKYNDKVNNPFKEKRSKSYNNKIKISAIVADQVLIGKKWYKVSDKIKQYKIISIDFNSISVEDTKTKKILNLKVFDEK